MRFKKLVLTTASIIALSLSVGSVSADTLGDIIAKGKLVVGVKADYAPWGMRDTAGNVVGMEIDMIKDLAKRIGDKAGKTIEVELVVVVASNRMQFLEQGKTDIMIATMSDKPGRREVVGIVQPNYYSSGVAVLAHKDSGIKSWSDVAGKKICGIQGAWYNKDHGLKNGADMIVFKGVTEVEAAILDGRVLVGFMMILLSFHVSKMSQLNGPIMILRLQWLLMCHGEQRFAWKTKTHPLVKHFLLPSSNGINLV